ncbi:MAG: hypothetical protein PF690_17425 [Deltaproteobacteria bacterium]|nr:hypothetical protein [Deltaproteobacteria bacterium]
MKRTIKQCRGFDGEQSCSNCRRQNDSARRLVESMAADPDSDKRTCIHFLKS